MPKLINNTLFCLIFQNMALNQSIENVSSKFQLQSKTVIENLQILEQKGCIYKHQREALQKLNTFFNENSNNNNRPETALLVLPTGTGKSGIAILAPYILSARRVLIVTPSKTITRQLAKDIGYFLF